MDDNEQGPSHGDQRSAKIIPLRRSPSDHSPEQLAGDLQRLALDAGATLANVVATADEYDVEVPVQIRQAVALLEESTLALGSMNRRQLLGNAALLAGTLLLRQRTSAMQGLRRAAGYEANQRVAHVLKTGRVDAATVADMETVTAAYRRSYRQLSARTLLPQAEGQVELIHELLDGSMKPKVRDRLTATAAEATALVGVMLLMDLYSFDAAWSKLIDALNAAQEAKAQELEAFILGCMAFNAGYTGRRVEAIDLITQARKLGAEVDGTRTRGWLAAVEGELRARTGNAKACLAALEAAEDSLRAIAGVDERPWVGIGAFDSAKLKGYYGLCYLQLKRPQEAVRELTEAIDSLDPAFRKHRCTALADLATALIRLGEIQEGCQRASQAFTLAIELRHAVSVDRIRDLDRHLAPWADVPAVKAFREQLMEEFLLAFYQSTLPVDR
jgi:tetratricopeptide (TPR) repeat protein